MRESINIKKMKYPEWLALRSSYLGTSEWAKVLGISKWGTPLSVYTEKVDGAEPFDNAILKHGRDQEPVVTTEFERATKFKLSEDPFIRFHPEYPCLATNLDRVTVTPDYSAIVELKTTVGFVYDTWEESGLDIFGNPARLKTDYQIQVQGQMLITGYKKAYTIVQIMREYSKYRTEYVIQEWDRDPEFKLTGLYLSDWWNNHVVKKDPPEPTQKADLPVAFPTHIPDSGIYASDEIVRDINYLKDKKMEVKQQKELVEDLETRIKIYIGDNEKLIGNDGILATWKQSNGRKYFQSKLFKQEHPDLYDEYMANGNGSRRFILK
jgi:putative phage-type endonuclease|tara:strand:- start:3240 stop:4208 length:969 start_codon:yes stop_codon:yes gene_type:complete